MRVIITVITILNNKDWSKITTIKKQNKKVKYIIKGLKYKKIIDT